MFISEPVFVSSLSASCREGRQHTSLSRSFSQILLPSALLVIPQKRYVCVGLDIDVGVGVDVGIGIGVDIGFGNGVVVAFGISVGFGLSVNIDVGADVSIGVGGAGHVETVTTRRRRHRESLLPFRPKSNENLHEANKRRSEGMNRPSSIHTSAGAVILLLPIYTSLSQSLC